MFMFISNIHNSSNSINIIISNMYTGIVGTIIIGNSNIICCIIISTSDIDRSS